MSAVPKLRCTHVLASIADAAAGPTYSVSGLCQDLQTAGADVRILSIRDWRAAGPELISQFGCPSNGIPSMTYPQSLSSIPGLAALCMSASLKQQLFSEALRVHVIHSHGLWLMPNIYAAWATAQGESLAKMIVSPRGMLGSAALSFSKWKKTLFWHALQRSALRSAACLHATSMAELVEIRSAGLNNPVSVIPNGIHLPTILQETKPTARANRTVLSLGRVHPKKGLDVLIRAWAQIEPVCGDWKLRIIGPPELQHDVELRALASSLNLKSVSIEAPVFGSDRLAAYRSADLFVLPTRNENFAMTVAEALAAGVPVISTKGAPWAGLETEACGWWVDHGVEPLVAALWQAMARPEAELKAMGARGRVWMERDFSWIRVASDMLEVYRWVAGAGDQPGSVHI